MAHQATPPMTGRDVLPPTKRKRAQPGPAPLPQIVVVQRPDKEARQWADAALASASELEEQLAQERAAHAATQQQLEVQRLATQEATERAESAETLQRIATDQLTQERLTRRAEIVRAEAAEREIRGRAHDHEQALARAQSERWRLEEELAAMTERAAVAEAQRQALEEARRAIGAELAHRDMAIGRLEARLDASNTALHRNADERNQAVLENRRLQERVEVLTEHLERIRHAVR